uniref:Reverse transcriptase domain-containing protein n=2 Tax=Cacopsylla melanoneura TaxID=428564 RepID=A0A8D8TF38_9HEMI
MDKSKYDEKINAFLDEESVEKLKKDPTTDLNKLVREALQNDNSLFQQAIKFYNMNSFAPALYGLLKVHKACTSVDIPGTPIRPVVSGYSSPTYRLEKEVVKLFHRVTKWKPKFSIKNSNVLIEDLKTITIPDTCMLISLDIDNLFTNVDMKTAMNLMIDIVKCTSDLSKDEVDQFVTYCELIYKSNYFTFGDQYYKNCGLPMGSPMSPLLAEIYVDNFEQKVFRTDVISLVLKYYRYVDDILLLFMGDLSQVDFLMSFINSVDKKLQFKVEVGENSINFLDTTISIQGNKIEWEIYRKTSYTDAIIPFNSVSPDAHKRAFFVFAIDRLINLEPKNPQIELNTIVKIATNNGYPPSMVFNIMKKRQKIAMNKMLYKTKGKIENVKYYVKIPFLGQVSHNIAHYINSLGKKVAFYPLMTTKLFLSNQKNMDPMLKSGVYEIACNCGAVYVGQSGRALITRICEHYANTNRYYKAVENIDLDKNVNNQINRIKAKYVNKSSVSDHIFETGHEVAMCRALHLAL